MVLPVLFIAKRLAFVSVIIVTNEFLCIKIALMNLTALASVSFTLWYMPMESKQAKLFEAFNDCNAAPPYISSLVFLEHS